MGRTLPTFNTYLLEEIEAWGPFRRALRREHKEIFDRLMTRARIHAAEASNVARPVPFDAVVMAILLGQELELDRLKKKVERLSERKAMEREPNQERGGNEPG